MAEYFDHTAFPRAGAVVPPAATDAPAIDGRSLAERFFYLADMDNNGELSEDEFTSSVVIRVKIKNAGIAPMFPLKRDGFLKLVPKPGGK